MANHILLTGGMSVRLALVEVPPPLEAGGEQARRLIASLCPAGTQITADEDDLGASASSASPPSRIPERRIIAEAYCNDGTASLQDILVAAGMGSVDRMACDDSEFAARPWAAGACGMDDGRETDVWSGTRQ